MVAAKEGRIITWVAAGVARVMPSATAALWPRVGKGVSKQSVVSELPSCSSARMAVDDSLSDWEECSIREESVPGERVARLCIRMFIQTNWEALGWRQAGRLQTIRWRWAGATALLKLGWWKAVRDGHEGAAPGVLSLCVCEAFTSNTLAVSCWFLSWVWGKRIRRGRVNHSK